MTKFLHLQSSDASNYLCDECVSNLTVSYAFLSLLKDAKHFYETRSKIEVVTEEVDEEEENLELSDVESDNLNETENVDVKSELNILTQSSLTSCHEYQYCVKSLCKFNYIEKSHKGGSFLHTMLLLLFKSKRT